MLTPTHCKRANNTGLVYPFWCTDSGLWILFILRLTNKTSLSRLCTLGGLSYQAAVPVSDPFLFLFTHFPLFCSSAATRMLPLVSLQQVISTLFVISGAAAMVSFVTFTYLCSSLVCVDFCRIIFLKNSSSFSLSKKYKYHKA